VSHAAAARGGPDVGSVACSTRTHMRGDVGSSATVMLMPYEKHGAVVDGAKMDATTAGRDYVWA